MKKPVKIVLLWLIGIILLATVLYGLLGGFCLRGYNKVYTEWLPYQENDSLVFTSGNEKAYFVVKEVYQQCNCGHSSESYNASLGGALTTIEIQASPHYGENKVLSVVIGEYTNTTYNVFPKDGKPMAEANFTIEKGRGVTLFNYSGKAWKLKEHIKKGTEPKVD